MSLARVETLEVGTSTLLPERVTLEQQLHLWRDVAEFANHIAATEFVPKDLRNKPASVAAAMLRANELGISPMQGLAQIHVINGRPGLAAELMRALVFSHGHEIWTETHTQTNVTVCGRRQGSDHVEKVTWTPDDVKRAGLGGDGHRKYPRAMLLARASAELCRLLFPDVLAGMSYAIEELVDMAEDDDFPGEPEPEGTPPPAKTQTRKAAGTAKRAAKRTAVPAALPAGAPPMPPLPGEESELDDDAVTKRAQQIAMKARDADVDHHLVVAAVTNGEKTSAKTLTEAEAGQVIEALNSIRDGRARLVDGDDGSPRVVTVDQADQLDLGGDEFEWSAEQWTAFLKEHGIAKSDLLKEATRWCGEHDEKPPTNLDALKDRDVLCVWLVSWAQEQSS